MHCPRSWSSRQRGISLVEMLLGFVLLSLALLGGAHLQATLRHQAEIARQRTEAVHLAQRVIERVRNPSSPSTPRLTDEVPEPVPLGTPMEVLGQTARYTVLPQVTEGSPGALRSATISVDWVDRRGAPHQVGLDTQFSGLSPLYSAVLSVTPPHSPALGRRPAARWQDAVPSPTDIPPDTVPLENHRDRGLWRPPGPEGDAYVLDLETGRIVSQCKIDPMAPRKAASSLPMPRTCTDLKAALVRGYVRFALGSSPDPAQANDTPLPFDSELIADSGTGSHVVCETQSMKGVRYTQDGVDKTREVAASASPASVGVLRWIETGERYAAYVCHVPLPAGRPSGPWRWHLLPHGWALGTTADTRRLCRYVDTSAASPSTSASAPGTPPRTEPGERGTPGANYLVVRGDLPCPQGLARPPHNGVPAATVPHSP